ncbi:uncharacterized protein LOC142357114 [Convolutriloba macropyga]|uniref:uncharacterized protein LOC142357114 n=1 Tax=Convolutriloba macropyga TaxID=536237 RepID=UPI003F52498A
MNETADQLDETARKARTAAALNRLYKMKTGKKLGQTKKTVSSSKESLTSDQNEADHVELVTFDKRDSEDESLRSHTDTPLTPRDNDEDFAQENEELKSQLQSLSDRIAELERIIREQKSEIEDKDGKVNRLEEREKELLILLEQAKSASKDGDQDLIDELRRQIKELEEKLEAKTIDVENAEKTLAEVEKRAEELSDENDELWKRIERLKSKLNVEKSDKWTMIDDELEVATEVDVGATSRLLEGDQIVDRRDHIVEKGLRIDLLLTTCYPRSIQS